MPIIHLNESSLLDTLHEVYAPFEKVLARVLNTSAAEVRQRRVLPKDFDDELFEHWEAQVGRYDEIAERFIPKAIRCLQARRMLPKKPDRDWLNRVLSGTRLGWVIFPAYYRKLDFYNALDVPLGVRWWIVAADRVNPVTWESFAELTTWDADIYLHAGNVLEFVEGTWLLTQEDDFAAQMQRAELPDLIRNGFLLGDQPMRVLEIAREQEYWEALSAALHGLQERPELADMPLSERLVAKRRLGMPLSDGEQALADGKTFAEVLHHTAEEAYDTCPSDERMAAAVERAKRGLWGWLRRNGAAYTPQWYVEVAELTGDGNARRKAEAAKTFMTTHNSSDFYLAWEAIAQQTPLEEDSPADLPAPPFPTSLEDYLAHCGITIATLREQITEFGEDVFLADDEAEAAYQRGDVLAAAGIPGAMLSEEGSP